MPSLPSLLSPLRHLASLDPRGLLPSDFGDGRYGLSGLPQASHPAVPGGLVCRSAEEPCGRGRPVADLGPGLVQDGVKVAAQAAARDGVSGMRPAGRLCRGGGELCGRPAAGSTRPAPWEECGGDTNRSKSPATLICAGIRSRPVLQVVKCSVSTDFFGVWPRILSPATIVSFACWYCTQPSRKRSNMQ